MNQYERPELFYQSRIKELEHTLKLLNRKRIVFGWARFTTILFTAVIVYNSWEASTILTISIAAAGVSLFFYRFKRHRQQRDY